MTKADCDAFEAAIEKLQFETRVQERGDEDVFMWMEAVNYGRQTASPPLFRVCEACDGYGNVLKTTGANALEDEWIHCDNCDHGKIWIYWTPEEWLAWWKENRPDEVPELDAMVPIWALVRDRWESEDYGVYMGDEDVYPVVLNLSAFGQPAPPDTWRPDKEDR